MAVGNQKYMLVCVYLSMYTDYNIIPMAVYPRFQGQFLTQKHNSNNNDNVANLMKCNNMK